MPPLPPQQSPDLLDPALVDREVGDAILRLCELSDVNPARRRRRLVAFTGVATLWAEAAILLAAQAPLGFS